MNTYVAQIRTAIEEMNVDQARSLVRDAMRENPTADVYFLASKIALDSDQKRDFLQKALDLDPFHPEAKAALNALNGGGGARSSSEFTSQAASGPIVIEKRKHAGGYEVAGGGARLGAFIIDVIILFVIGYLAGFIYSRIVPVPDLYSFRTSGEYLSAISSYAVGSLGFGIIVNAIYMVYFLSRNNGQTPGKRALNIRVVKKDGQPLTIVDALIRNVVGYAVSTMFFFLGFIWILFDGDHQGWHDKFVGTVVVKD